MMSGLAAPSAGVAKLRHAYRPFSADRRQRILTEQELVGVNELWQKNLVPITRLTTLQREEAKLDGTIAQLASTVAQGRGKVAELRLQLLQLDQDQRTEAVKELSAIRAKMNEMVEQRITAEDQLRRIDIRAPQDGVVHQLQVHTIGGVVGQGNPIMNIVPVSDRLVVEVRIPPASIDQVRVGHPAVLTFPAFSRHTTPELNGEVSHVSADIEVDQKSGQASYMARLAIADAELSRLAGLRLVPGMPVESLVQTGGRTVLSYLVKPLHDQLKRAFRER